MARGVYSFTKIEKKRTHIGIVSLVTGVLCLVLFAGLMVWTLAKGGIQDHRAGIAGLFGMLLSLASVLLAGGTRRNEDVYGRFLTAGYRISVLALVLYVILFMAGLLMIII